MPTAAKLRWIDALHAAGLREIEVASFVPARLLPQMADAAEVVRHACTLPGLTVMALVPNRRGAEAALAAGVHKLTMPVSASAAHSLANVRKTREAMVEEVRAIAALRREQRAARQARSRHLDRVRLHAAGRGARRRRDPAGAAHVPRPAPTKSGCPTPSATPTRRRCGACSGGCAPSSASRPAPRTCTTRAASGWPTAWPRYEEGVRTFDASLGGLGGCPYAPGASGNVVTEDLVFMFEAMGVRTGIDIEQLIAARAPLVAGLPGEPVYGMTPAGRPAEGLRARMAAHPCLRPQPLPYAGIRVVEFTHMVMGPTCGMLLGDLGAEVIKVEPIDGDDTRRLLGSGAGFFPTFNRNKKSIALDLKQPGRRGSRAAPDRDRRRRQRELQARHDGQARPRLRDAARSASAPDLREPQGLPARPVRAPHRARRGGADDGRPGLHDRPRGRPAARRVRA